ncbi:hypothetical protein BDN72DRAFT_654568 [Pluteus cervinus]|uniref:Uncharacterized protein n=1 Tax=Pluteus cervinus TaxID=181527 RepID=A0ACD3AT66_9AGAR|nr:hypothetical protein BDN72DRAFT_654568 [Pluteus cervinus]
MIGETTYCVQWPSNSPPGSDAPPLFPKSNGILVFDIIYLDGEKARDYIVTSNTALLEFVSGFRPTVDNPSGTSPDFGPPTFKVDEWPNCTFSCHPKSAFNPVAYCGMRMVLGTESRFVTEGSGVREGPTRYRIMDFCWREQTRSDAHQATEAHRIRGILPDDFSAHLDFPTPRVIEFLGPGLPRSVYLYLTDDCVLFDVKVSSAFFYLLSVWTDESGTRRVLAFLFTFKKNLSVVIIWIGKRRKDSHI